MEKCESEGVQNDPQFKYRGAKAMPFVIGNETFEKLGTLGTSSNLLVYLTTVFNMNTITATTMINIFNGTTNFATLIGAFLCDTYFGRYKTLGFASVASFLGMLILTLTAAISMMHPPHCNRETNEACHGPTPWQMSFLVGGLGFLVIGAGGIRPCNLAFGADQFNPKTESGKRGINSFFNWYYFTFSFAMLISLTVIVYVQSDVSWAIGLAIPAFLMFLSCVLFFIGSKIYVKLEPEGSPLTSVVKVIVAAAKKRKLMPLEQPSVSLFNHTYPNSINSKLPYTDQFRFLDKAATRTPEDKIELDGSVSNPWRLCSMQQVEEVKCLLRILPIWASGIIYYVAMVQQQTYVVFQAFQFDRRLGGTNFKIPPASYTIFSLIGVSFWIPIYDQVVVPLLRKITKIDSGITNLTKMAIGMVIAIITMLISAIVEDRRRTLALEKPIGIEPGRGAISPMSGLWLVPQLTLIGLSEAFTIIAQVEFYYKQFPENMRSIGASFLFISFGGSNYLSGFLVSIVHKLTKGAATGNWLPEDLNMGRLDYFYYLVAAMGFVNFGFFLLCAKWYKYKESGDIVRQVDIKGMQPETHIVQV